MFEAFQRNFPRDPGEYKKGGPLPDLPAIPGLREFLSAFGGASFRNGLYRAIHAEDLEQWRSRVLFAFPQFKGRITCFGYDWMGSTFAVDSRRLEKGQPGVLLFEPGTSKVLEIPSNIQTFHNSGLVEFGEAALAISFYQKWITTGGAAPSYTQCVGYKVPLFLGGKDEVENLELSDLDVYWHLMGQLIVQTRDLPVGTRVRTKIK